MFIEGFKLYFEYIITTIPDLKNMLNNKLNIKYFDEAVDFLKDLFQNNLLGKSLGSIHLKLSWNGIFVNESSLNKLN